MPRFSLNWSAVQETGHDSSAGFDESARSSPNRTPRRRRRPRLAIRRNLAFVGTPNGPGGPPTNWVAWVAFLTAVALAITAWIAVYNGWIQFGKSRRCEMSGTVFSSFSQGPASGIRLGYAPDGSDEFEPLTRSRPDGTFSASCENARERTTGDSFELLAEPTWHTGPLPCIPPRPPEHTDVFVDRRGESNNLSVEVAGC